MVVDIPFLSIKSTSSGSAIFDVLDKFASTLEAIDHLSIANRRAST
jgi:hypothetical protein